jgi:hypothetical protein
MDRNFHLGRPIKQIQENLDTTSCVRRILDDSNQPVKGAAFEDHLLSDANVTTRRDDSIRSGFSHQEGHDGLLNNRRCSIETYNSFHSRTPNDGAVVIGRKINTGKKVIGKKRDDWFPALGNLGQSEFRKESLNASQAEVRIREILPLRLGIDRAPLFLWFRHLPSIEPGISPR